MLYERHTKKPVGFVTNHFLMLGGLNVSPKQLEQRHLISTGFCRGFLSHLRSIDGERRGSQRITCLERGNGRIGIQDSLRDIERELHREFHCGEYDKLYCSKP